VDIVERIEETLRVGFETDIAAMEFLLELFILQVKGIFTIGEGGVTLQVKRVSCVTDNIVVGVLATLGGDDFCSKAAVGFP